MLRILKRIIMTNPLILVDSSMIRAIAYYPDFLLVWFKNGKIYEYTGVPEREYSNLRDTPSVGKLFHSSIRDKYRVSGVFAA